MPGSYDVTLPRMRACLDESVERDLGVADHYGYEYSQPHLTFEQLLADCDNCLDSEYDLSCRANILPCNPAPDISRQHRLGPTSRPAPTSPAALQQRKSNADPRQGDKMESSTDAGAPGVPAAATGISQDAYVPESSDSMRQITDTFLHTQSPNAKQEQYIEAQSDVLQASGGTGAQHTPGAERAANILANGVVRARGDSTVQPEDADITQMRSIHNGEDDRRRGSQQQSAENAEDWTAEYDGGPQNTLGFCKLVLPDGDYIVTTYDVEVGRNAQLAAIYKRDKKERQREQQREQRRERVPPSRRELAQRELEMYQQEPSQPSLPGDEAQQGDVSNSSQSLQGRPGPPATFSESGGGLAFAQGSDHEEQLERGRGRSKRRSFQHSKSSNSTTSVVPAHLHPSLMDVQYTHRELHTEDGQPYSRTLAFLPIHPQCTNDIFKISKRHLLFQYNFQEERWELVILGKFAFVNDELFNEGDLIPLSHNDEIQVCTVTITFKLPDNHRNSPGLSRGTFSQLGVDAGEEDSSEDETRADGTSPVRRLSHVMEGALSSEDDNRPASKLKLSCPKKSQKEKVDKPGLKLSLKKQQRRGSVARSPADEDGKVEKPEKGKKPKAAARQPAPAKVEESIEAPISAPVFTAEPGSALASVPVDELPQKRKGPGRPPKNGLVSKRDQALVRKKEREFEKQGREIPAFNKLLDMVRAETKQKEFLAKMQSGTLPPGTEIPQPVEVDLVTAAAKASAVPSSMEAGEQTGGIPAEKARRPSSPGPKRVARSPSPMKPESSYAEEDLKKPTATYVHILDEILRDHPAGHADLQEIYDRIQKRYPFFKYRVTTQGWQSSVRHNLLSAPRFKETGKSGKGKLWTIDYDVPLEREKKKKPTPPPRPMPMMNGQYMQYGQQTYGGAYGGQPPNDQRPVHGTAQGYYSPYGQGQAGQHAPGQQPPNRTGQTPPGQIQPNSGQAQPQPDPFGGLVPEILNLRNEFLLPYTNESTIQTKSEWIGKCIMIFSNRFHGSGDQPELSIESSEEKKAFAGLDSIFKRYEAMKAQQQQAQNGSSATPAQHGAGAPPAQVNSAVDGSNAHASSTHRQTVQTAVADGVAFQNANSGLSPTMPRPPASQEYYSTAVPTTQTQGRAPMQSAHAAPLNGNSLPGYAPLTASPAPAASPANGSIPSGAAPHGLSSDSHVGSLPPAQPIGFVDGSSGNAQPANDPAQPAPPTDLSDAAQRANDQARLNGSKTVPDARLQPVATASQLGDAVQQIRSETTGTKRAAEDDTEDIDAKRVKVD